MTTKQKFGVLVFLLLLAGGTSAHWLIFPNADLKNTTISYVNFLATVVGFFITIYQLRETERAIEENFEKPQLEIELLPANQVGIYSSEANNIVSLYPVANKTGYFGTHLGLRIVNKGNKAASRIYLTFVFLPKGAKGDDVTSKINVLFDQSKAGETQIVYADSDVRNGYQIGWTFKFSESLVIYADLYDRPIVAALDLLLREVDFGEEYEINYRIQSYEGNKSLEEITKKHGAEKNQTYLVKFKKVS